jgi:hypothetical protein
LAPAGAEVVGNNDDGAFKKRDGWQSIQWHVGLLINASGYAAPLSVPNLVGHELWSKAKNLCVFSPNGGSRL